MWQQARHFCNCFIYFIQSIVPAVLDCTKICGAPFATPLEIGAWTRKLRVSSTLQGLKQHTRGQSLSSHCRCTPVSQTGMQALNKFSKKSKTTRTTLWNFTWMAVRMTALAAETVYCMMCRDSNIYRHRSPSVSKNNACKYNRLSDCLDKVSPQSVEQCFIRPVPKAT